MDLLLFSSFSCPIHRQMMAIGTDEHVSFIFDCTPQILHQEKEGYYSWGAFLILGDNGLELPIKGDMIVRAEARSWSLLQTAQSR